MLPLQMLRGKLEQMRSNSMSNRGGDKPESQQWTDLNSKHTSNISNVAAPAGSATSEIRRWPHRWDATETLRWFGTSFPFSDLYIDRFAELDIDAEALQNISDAELRDEVQVRGTQVDIVGTVSLQHILHSSRLSTGLLLDWTGHQIGNAIHRRRILEEIQRLGTCPSTASNARSDGRSNDGAIKGNHTLLKSMGTEESRAEPPLRCLAVHANLRSLSLHFQ